VKVLEEVDVDVLVEVDVVVGGGVGGSVGDAVIISGHLLLFLELFEPLPFLELELLELLEPLEPFAPDFPFDPDFLPDFPFDLPDFPETLFCGQLQIPLTTVPYVGDAYCSGIG